MANYDKAVIYFDTNSLECRQSRKLVSLSRFIVNALYYDIENLVVSLGLGLKVQFCVPEIVWLEMRAHLVSQFQSIRDSMNTNIESYQKEFGDLIELNCKFKYFDNVPEYKEYICSSQKEFLENTHLPVSIIPYPRDQETLEEIVMQAINSNEPFRSAKGQGKEYSDAGFKDAMIIKTIEKNLKDDTLMIFITNDHDFENVLSRENFHLCNDKDSVRSILCESFEIVDKDELLSIIKADEYLQGRILTEVGFTETLPYQFISALSCKQIKEGTQAEVLVEIENERYVFTILYDVKTRELLNASYEKCDGDEISNADSY